MEFFGLLLFAFIFYLYLSKLKRKVRRKFGFARKRVVRTRWQSASSPQPNSFDAETSHNVEEPEIVAGRAYVIDGDSIVIQKTQIRLFGIDAPELNHPYGKKAKWALLNLCKG